ncbi:MAG: ABC transporter ATP-binding protein [Spirochaetaceae bacterium]|nr:MAG: ABC transporter ATP-binding protein [Spirochaetaceae bacterium]
MIIGLDDVSFGYSEHPLFDGLRLTVPEGVTAVMGPNGAGKSTLLSIMIGWLKPSRGRVEWFGTAVSGFDRRQRAQVVGMVSTDAALPFAYSVRDYVLLGRGPHIASLAQPTATDEEHAVRAMEEVGITALAERSVQELSSGEQQLAQIARCIAQNPRIILMDEPAGHLDPANSRRLSSLMHALAQRGVNIVFTSHDPLFSKANAAHAILIRRGGLFCAGLCDQVITADNLTALYEVPFRDIPDGARTLPVFDL